MTPIVPRYMLGMGPVLWRAAFKRVYPSYHPRKYPVAPYSRAYCESVTHRLPVSRTYYKMLDRINLDMYP